MITAGTSKYTPTESFRQWVLTSSVDTLKARYPSEYEAWKAHAYHSQLDEKLDKSLRPFGAFMLAIGPKPSPEMSLDQIDRTRLLVADNLRWASPEDQAANKSKAQLYTYLGCPVPITLAALCRTTNKVTDTVRKQLKKKPIGEIIPGAVESAPEPSSNYGMKLFYASKKYPGKEQEYPWPTDKPGCFDYWESQFRSKRGSRYKNTKIGRLRFLVETLRTKARDIQLILNGIAKDENGEPLVDEIERGKLTHKFQQIDYRYKWALPRLEAAEKEAIAKPVRKVIHAHEHFDPGDEDPGDTDPRDWVYQEEPTTQPPAHRHTETFDDLPPHLQESFRRDVEDGMGNA